MATDLSVSRAALRKLAIALWSSLGIVTGGYAQTSRTDSLPVRMAPPAGAQAATAAGALSVNKALNISLSLGYRDPAGVQRFVDSVSDPKSPTYRQFITPTEVGRRFGPTPETIAKAKSFLTSNGLSVTLVSANGLSILAEGTVANIQTAFKTKISKFVSTDASGTSTDSFFSYTSAPMVPADLQPYVVNVGGLENFTRPKARLNPTQVQNVYNLTTLYATGSKGEGRTVGISNWDGFRLSNVPYLYSQWGLPTPSGGVGSNITVKKISGGAGAGTQQGEADLDIQTVLTAAPLCNLIIYDGGSNDLIGVLTQEVNDNQADIITESWGWQLPTSTANAVHNLHLSMNAQGITYMAASGDSGTTISYYYPDIDPEVLSVGGTTCKVDILGNRTSETGWSGSGGGWKPTSDSFNKLPSYQSGSGVPTNIPYRLVPDVALNADPNTGYVVRMGSSNYIIGGTSGACPTFAGALALVQQQLIANGALTANSAGKYRLGRLQDTIYALNGDSSVFTDITSGTNGNLPDGSKSNAVAGWDFVTGWGVVKFDGFVAKLSGSGLAQFVFSPTATEGGTATITGTISTVTVAPDGGTDVALSGGDSAITYPAKVTIPKGARSVTFSVTTSAVASARTETITATLGNKTKTATLTVNPTTIASLKISPNTGVSNGTVTGTVTLAHAAPSDSNLSVALTGGDSSITYPATVNIASGSTTGTFNISIGVVAGSKNETLTATLGTSKATGTFSVTGVSIASLLISPGSLLGGLVTNGTINLTAVNGSVPISIVVTGGDSATKYPATVNIPAGAKAATFAINTSAVDKSTVETILVTLGATTKSSAFTITPPTLTAFTIDPTSVFGGGTATGKLTLNGAAGPSGVDVAISGGDSSITYDAKVTVPAGQTTKTFTFTTKEVQTAALQTIKATLATANPIATFTVKPAGVVASVSFAPTGIVGGKPATGTVTLTGPCGPKGVTVNLTGGDSSVKYPSSISIAAGGTSGTFAVTSSVVSTSTPETITATLGASSAKGTLTLSPLAVTSLTLAPASVFSGVSTVGTVTISGPASSAGLDVALSGGDSSVSFPSKVSIASGATTATFTVTTSKVSVVTQETIKATVGSSAAQCNLTLKPAGVVFTLAFSPASVVGGVSSTGTVTLTGGAGPEGVTVTLTGGDSGISYPATLTIPSGATSKTFTVTTAARPTGVTETITAAIGPSSAKGNLVVASPTLSAVTVSPTSIFGGYTSTGTLTLSGKAPADGMTVVLSGGDASISFPAKLTIPQGSSSATFTITSKAVAVKTSELIKAVLGSSSLSTTLVVNPAGVVASLAFSPANLAGGASSVGTITLTGPCGPEGVTVTLSGGDSSITYPATVKVKPGFSNQTFSITTVPVNTSVNEVLAATIGSSSARATLAVSAASLVGITFSSPITKGGVTVTGTITLSSPVGPAGAVIALSGTDSSVTYPATASIAAGGTTATFKVTTPKVTGTKIVQLVAKFASVAKSSVLTIKP